jgi:GNAT superfamily N-acetyltransferase
VTAAAVELRIQGSIRPCRRADLRHLEWFGMFTDHRAIFRAAWDGHRRGTNVMLVADLHGFPAGQVWIDLARKGASGIGVVWALRVHPVLYRSGLGRALLGAAERELRRRGLATAEVAVEKDNDGACRLYRRAGYRDAGEATEPWSYVKPDGTPVEHVLDLWILQKGLDGDDGSAARRDSVDDRRREPAGVRGFEALRLGRLPRLWGRRGVRDLPELDSSADGPTADR